MWESGHSAQYGVRSLFRTMAEPPFESAFHKLGSCSIQTAIKSVFLIQALHATARALYKQLPSLKGGFGRLTPE